MRVGEFRNFLLSVPDEVPVKMFNDDGAESDIEFVYETGEADGAGARILIRPKAVDN